MFVYALWVPVGAMIHEQDKLIGIYPDRAAARTAELSLKVSHGKYDYMYITKIEMGKAYVLSEDSDYTGELL